MLAEAFGEERVLGALADTSGELLPDGAVVFTRNVNILLGELSGDSEPAGAADRGKHRRLRCSSRRCGQYQKSRKWSKFAAWVGLVALSVTTLARRPGATWRSPGSALVLARLVREMGELMRALKIELTDESGASRGDAMSGQRGDCCSGSDGSRARVRVEGARAQDVVPAGSRGRTAARDPRDAFGVCALQKAAQSGLALSLVETFYQRRLRRRPDAAEPRLPAREAFGRRSLRQVV